MRLIPLNFDDLVANYGQCSSWAVWNRAKLTDTRIISDNKSCLKTSVVMVALNLSVDGRIVDPWQNFHSNDHARKLMYAFNDSPYRGAYLTDIIKEEIEPSSGKLMTRMRNGYDVQKHIDSFGAEMDRVGVDKNALFILFGNDVYELFAKHLASTYSNHVKCRHYSHYRTNDAEWVEEAWSKLEAHYVKTRGTLKTLKFVRNRRMKAQLEKLREKLDRL